MLFSNLRPRSSPASAPLVNTLSTFLRTYAVHARVGLDSLKPAKDSWRNAQRLGRGDSSGRGGTSGRGHKGLKARGGAGSKVPQWSEGGQTPLTRRYPKRGFWNIGRQHFQPVPLSRLLSWIQQGRIDPTRTITTRDIVDSRLVHGLTKAQGVKIVSDRRPITDLPPLDIVVSRASKEAVNLIDAAGGTITFKYYNRLALRQHLLPEKFIGREVKEAAPTKKRDILFYRKAAQKEEERAERRKQLLLGAPKEGAEAGVPPVEAQ